MRNKIDISGKKFGLLRVVKYSHTNRDKKACWLCICDCGKSKIISGKSLRSGNTKSCGCISYKIVSEANTTHGDCAGGKKPEYLIWRAMKERCLNPNNKNYNRYGGRGIKICDRWVNDYGAFLSDMGRKPFKNAQLDRKNNDGNYEPSNCRWITQKEQVNNKSTNRKLSLNGKTQSIQDWSIETGISYSTICMRLFRKWTVERTLTYGSK